MIGAVIAMESEANILLSEMKVERELTISGKKVFIGKAFGKETALCICGVGKVNAALGAQLLISKFDAKCLLNFGVAGGLNDGTKLCQVYQIEAAVQFDFDYIRQIYAGFRCTCNCQCRNIRKKFLVSYFEHFQAYDDILK